MPYPTPQAKVKASHSNDGHILGFYHV